jgi:hypothetical protein
MQIRCNNCHKPFALGKDAVYEALEVITEEDLNHYTAACPHCRKTNKVSREELLRSAPGWSPGSSIEEESQKS